MTFKRRPNGSTVYSIYVDPGKLLIAGGLLQTQQPTDVPTLKAVEVIDVATSTNCDNLPDLPIAFKSEFRPL